MAYLVDRQLLLPCQLSILVYCVLFEEVPDLVSRCEEVVISNVIVVVRREFGLWTCRESNADTLVASDKIAYQWMIIQIEIGQQLPGARQ